MKNSLSELTHFISEVKPDRYQALRKFISGMKLPLSIMKKIKKKERQ